MLVIAIPFTFDSRKIVDTTHTWCIVVVTAGTHDGCRNVERLRSCRLNSRWRLTIIYWMESTSALTVSMTVIVFLLTSSCCQIVLSCLAQMPERRSRLARCHISTDQSVVVIASQQNDPKRPRFESFQRHIWEVRASLSSKWRALLFEKLNTRQWRNLHLASRCDALTTSKLRWSCITSRQQ